MDMAARASARPSGRHNGAAGEGGRPPSLFDEATTADILRMIFTSLATPADTDEPPASREGHRPGSCR
ncbi:hypothetical protein [Streptomyces sp. NPDC051636]|uniref:hypothetical protein n=1 Tax=Streptomyces sp. NPDC051636 TaxID=3365663 RepID=UPI0037B7E1AE